jgi:hypothetical protein
LPTPGVIDNLVHGFAIAPAEVDEFIVLLDQMSKARKARAAEGNKHNSAPRKIPHYPRLSLCAQFQEGRRSKVMRASAFGGAKLPADNRTGN